MTYILFYSDKCKYSRQLLTILSNNQQLNKLINKINVLNTNIKIPSVVTSVPTLIVKNPNMKPQLYVGEQIMQWIDIVNQSNNNSNNNNKNMQKNSGGNWTSDNSTMGHGSRIEEGVAWNDPSIMSSAFSDNFSIIGQTSEQNSGRSMIQHCFAPINDIGMSLDPKKCIKTYGILNNGNNSGNNNEMMGGAMNRGSRGTSQEQHPSNEGRGMTNNGMMGRIPTVVTNEPKNNNMEMFKRNMEEYIAQRNADIPQAPRREGGVDN